MIIGLTSLSGAGKTTVSEYLVKKGFEYYSLSDILREELKKKGKEITRENLQEIGNELRRIHGNSVLAEKTLEKIRLGKNYVIDSIRNPSEIEALKKNKDFSLVFIDAPISTRFNRIKARKREQDPETFEEFRKSEEKELQSKDSSNQQLIKCREMADINIINDSTIEELYQKIEKMLLN